MTREQIFLLCPVSQLWSASQLDPETIIEIVSGYYRTKEDKVLSTCQDAELVWVRQLSMYFISHFTGLRSRQVVKYFPGRDSKIKDRSNVSWAISKVVKKMRSYPYVKQEVIHIERLINEQDIFHRYKRTA